MVLALKNDWRMLVFTRNANKKKDIIKQIIINKYDDIFGFEINADNSITLSCNSKTRFIEPKINFEVIFVGQSSSQKQIEFSSNKDIHLLVNFDMPASYPHYLKRANLVSNFGNERENLILNFVQSIEDKKLAATVEEFVKKFD